MIIHSNSSKMKNKILPTCLQGDYRDSLGEFNNTSRGMFVAERVKIQLTETSHYIFPTSDVRFQVT